jgi:hypothetical protein
MPSPLLQSGLFYNFVLNPVRTFFLNVAAEFFVSLDGASDALDAVSQAASKWPGWLHAENAKGSKHEQNPIVYHCEVRVGEGFCFECP